ncbi:MAG: alanine racemase [Acidobacteria bacterium]|nr:alanine racemase [Acidobacteriota bacterium]
MLSRRRVLSGLAAAGAGVVGGTQRATADQAAQPSPVVSVPPRSSSYDPWVEVHAANLAHNVAEIRRRVEGRPIIAVIKNNGYGCGVAVVGRLLDQRPEIPALAVVKLAEAMALRDAGVKKPVLLMGPCDASDLEAAIARDIEPMVYTPIGDVLERIATKRQRPVQVHVCVDTGIGRVGVPYREANGLMRDLASRRGVQIASAMMTFSEDADFDAEQVVRFRAVRDQAATDGVAVGFMHAASSFGLFQRPEAFFDRVRPGMAVFGVYSEPEFRTQGTMDLRPAVSLKARVAYVKQLQAGESAGYNRAYMATRPVWVATLPVGHADGWPRVAAKGARVAIGGGFYPVIASVSASHTIVEIGDTNPVAIGDVATFFGWEPGGRPEDVGAACGASVYDLTMHLGASLPRKVV